MTTLRNCKPMAALGAFAPVQCPIGKHVCRIAGQTPCDHYQGAVLAQDRAGRQTVTVKCALPETPNE